MGDAVRRWTASLLPSGGGRRPGGPLAAFSSAALVLALVLAWVVFAPVQIGGKASYVIVDGNSMEPGYHRGDLVVTREQGEYRVGDIAAYRHPQIGPIIHRVVERDGAAFIFQGDNNDWLDSYRPVESEFIGKAWVHIPWIGKPLGWLRGPQGMAVLAGIVGVFIMTTFATAKEKKMALGRGAGPPSASSGDGREGVVTVLGAVLLACLVLGILAFTRPAQVPVSDAAGYSHRGLFDYSAAAGAADVYDEGYAQTGEPIFRKLSEVVQVSFDYRLASDLPAERIEGSYRIVAEVSDVNGWKRTILLQPETPFMGEGFDTTTRLNLTDLRGIVTRLEKQTGLHTDRYMVSVVPEVTIGGELAGQGFEDDFAPRLDFWMDPLQLQLQSPVEGAAPADPTDPAAVAANPLEPVKEGDVAIGQTEPNTISLFVVEIAVWKARIVALAGLLLAGAGLWRFGMPVWRLQRSPDEPTRIQARHGAQIVAVGSDPCGDAPVIEVAHFEDLVKIAETQPGGESILHRAEAGLNDYYVRGAGAVYRYQAAF